MAAKKKPAGKAAKKTGPANGRTTRKVALGEDDGQFTTGQVVFAFFICALVVGGLLKWWL